MTDWLTTLSQWEGEAIQGVKDIAAQLSGQPTASDSAAASPAQSGAAAITLRDESVIPNTGGVTVGQLRQSGVNDAEIRSIIAFDDGVDSASAGAGAALAQQQNPAPSQTVNLPAIGPVSTTSIWIFVLIAILVLIFVVKVVE